MFIFESDIFKRKSIEWTFDRNNLRSKIQGCIDIVRKIDRVWYVDFLLNMSLSKINKSVVTIRHIRKGHFMNSVFVNPGIYSSCAVDAFLEISTHLFLPYLSSLRIRNEFTDLLFNVCSHYMSSREDSSLKVKCDHRSKFSNLSNWKEEALIFFQASSFQLLKSHFTFIYNRSTNMNYFM